jgi:hypothetical protein
MPCKSKTTRSAAFDVAALQQIVGMRKQDAAERESSQAIIDAYLLALGDLADPARSRADGARFASPDAVGLNLGATAMPRRSASGGGASIGYDKRIW